MPTRRKGPGFTAQKAEETASVEELLEENAREMFETFSQMEDEPETKEELVEPKEKPVPMQVILPEITPTEDAGPRFVEEPIAPPPAQKVTATTPQLQPPPKRHPRNIPKFSRYK